MPRGGARNPFQLIRLMLANTLAEKNPVTLMHTIQWTACFPLRSLVFTLAAEQMALSAIIPVKIQGLTLWAYLDMGSGCNFISSEVAKNMDLSPNRHETRQMVTLNGTKRQSMPVFSITMDLLHGITQEKIEVTGSKMPNSQQ